MIHYAWLGLLLGVVACIISAAVYPLVLRMARVWRVLDCSEERKLHCTPVPAMGGVVIFIGMFFTVALFFTFFPFDKYFVLLMTMMVLLLVGLWDDVKDISVWIRIVIETLVVVALIYYGGKKIELFGGVWGIGVLNCWWSWVISVLAGVGLMNAINLIDGVDGYSSAYIMGACFLFACVFYMCDMYGMGILSVVCIGAVFPFFLHNVFGFMTKMFRGNGGTLMIGTLIVGLTFSMLQSGSQCDAVLHVQYGMGLVSLGLSFLSIAVFDTLRVMFVRIIHKKSPFHPDKHYLHHIVYRLWFLAPWNSLCHSLLESDGGHCVVAELIAWG